MCRFVGLISVLTAGLIALAVPAQSQTPAGTWTQKAPMPAVRGEVAAAEVGGKLYAVGGNFERKVLPRNEEYDPATDRWRARAPLPEPRDHLGVATVGGKIYAFGGFTSSVHQGAGDGAFEYDPETTAGEPWHHEWSARFVGLAVLGGKIHVIGGRGLDNVTAATHEVYDVATGTWSMAAPLPRARDHMAVVAVDGKIHAIGGRLTGPADQTAQHDVYDPAANSWTSAAPLPTPRSGVAGVLYRGMILVLGGELPPGHTFPENESYDAKGDRWVTLAPLPAPR
jgi:N-acetylneuraminic acid mutarotase